MMFRVERIPWLWRGFCHATEPKNLSHLCPQTTVCVERHRFRAIRRTGLILYESIQKIAKLKEIFQQIIQTGIAD